MNKSDLKSGMMVRIKGKEELSLVLIGTDQGDVTCNLIPKECKLDIIRHYNYYGLYNYNNDLTPKKGSYKGVITAVYNEYGKLLWERESIPEYTMSDLIDKVGHNFKIKK